MRRMEEQTKNSHRSLDRSRVAIVSRTTRFCCRCCCRRCCCCCCWRTSFFILLSFPVYVPFVQTCRWLGLGLISPTNEALSLGLRRRSFYAYIEDWYFMNPRPRRGEGGTRSMEGRTVLDVSCTTPLFKCAVFQKCFSNARMPFCRRRWSRAFEEHDWWLVGLDHYYLLADIVRLIKFRICTLSVTLFITLFLLFSYLSAHQI